MAIRVAASETVRSPEQERTGVRMSRSRGLGELDEMEELFQQLVEGEGDFGELGELEDFDWEGLWDSFMEGEEGYGEREEPAYQGAHKPTMFGAPITPGGFRRPGSVSGSGYGMFY